MVAIYQRTTHFRQLRWCSLQEVLRTLQCPQLRTCQTFEQKTKHWRCLCESKCSEHARVKCCWYLWIKNTINISHQTEECNATICLYTWMSLADAGNPHTVPANSLHGKRSGHTYKAFCFFVSKCVSHRQTSERLLSTRAQLNIQEATLYIHTYSGN